MDSEYTDTPAITTRSFDLSLFSLQATGDSDVKLFEGRTSSLSRNGLEALVNDIRNPFKQFDSNESPENQWEGITVTAKFHAISPVLDEINGTIVHVKESDDARYRWVVDVEFESELNLLELRL